MTDNRPAPAGAAAVDRAPDRPDPAAAAACPGLEAEIRDDMQAVALHYLRRNGQPASDRDLACMGFTQGQIADHAMGVRSAAARQHASDLKNDWTGT